MPRIARAVVPFGCAALALSLVACGEPGTTDGDPSADEPISITLTWWGDDSRAAAMEESIAIYEDANPGVTIEGSFSDFASYFEKRTVEASANNLPDVMMFNLPFLRDYAERGLFLDLGTSDSLDVADVSDATLAGGQVQGTQYGIPLGTNVMSVMSNPLVYEAAGATLPTDDLTWDEFYDEAATINQADDALWGVDGSIGGAQVLELQLLQEGSSLFNDDGSLGFDQARLAEFWQDMADLASSSAAIPASREAEIAPQFGIAAGITASRVAFDNTGAQFLSDSAPELLLTAPPAAADAVASGLFPRPALLMVGASTTSHPDVVADFISFMVNDEQVGELFGASRGIPVTETQRGTIASDDVFGQALLEYENRVEPLLGDAPPAPPAGWAALDAHFNRIAEEIRSGTTNPVDGAAEFFTEVELALG